MQSANLKWAQLDEVELYGTPPTCKRCSSKCSSCAARPLCCGYHLALDATKSTPMPLWMPTDSRSLAESAAMFATTR